ncbi:MAG: hypothetical protein L3J63_07090 [Geopsychrobacter sp.]|nr:hypothetical protein [Geopsychrobacter sp.]
MRMMMTGPAPQPQARLILIFFYGYFLLHWLTGIVMFGVKLGFSYQSVVRYFVGDPELFMAPRSFSGLLEVTHFHLFAMGLFFVIFSHLLLFSPFAARFKTILIWLLGLSLLGDIIAPWLICYVAAPFVWLKLGAFWVLQVVSLWLLVGLLSGILLKSQARPVDDSWS